MLLKSFATTSAEHQWAVRFRAERIRYRQAVEFSSIEEQCRLPPASRNRHEKGTRCR